MKYFNRQDCDITKWYCCIMQGGYTFIIKGLQPNYMGHRIAISPKGITDYRTAYTRTDAYLKIFKWKEATLDECIWLEGCIKAGKFIPKSNYNGNYDIF